MNRESYPRRLYIELVFIGFAVVMGMGLATSFLPLLARDIDPTGVLVGFVVSAWFLSRLFVELPAGIISDRIGRRKLLIIGVGLSVVGAFLCSQAKIIYVLILGRAIWGLGAGLFFMNVTALIIDIFESKARGNALGIFNGLEFIGSFIGAPIGAFLAGVVSYSNVFYFTVVLILSSFTVALTSRGLKAVKANPGMQAHLSIRQTFSNLKNWSILLVCVTTFFRMFVMQGIFSTVFELFLNNPPLSFPVAYIGIVLSLRTGGQVVSTMSSGFLADRFGRKRITMAGFLIDAGCLAAFTLISRLEMFVVLGFVEGIGEGLVFTSLIVLLSDIAPQSVRGGALGLYRTFMDLGGFFGPMVLLMVYNLSPHASFIAALGINLANVTLLLFLRMKPSAKEKEAASTKT
jgi:MFS family permease